MPTLEIDDDEDSEVLTTVDDYLAKLWTLLLSYAMVGTHKRPGERPAETRQSETVDYVDVPLDVLWRYWQRAKQQAALGSSRGRGSASATRRRRRSTWRTRRPCTARSPRSRA